MAHGAQLRFSAFDLPLCLVELLLRLRELFIYRCKHTPVQRVDLVLIERDLDGIFHKAGRGDGRHAVYPLERGQDVFRDDLRGLDDVLAVNVNA